MAITKVQQLQISGTLAAQISDSVTNGNLVKENRTLVDDLNSLRTQVKLIMGTSAWTDNLSGSQDLADIYAAMHVNALTGIATFQNDIFVSGSVSGSGNFSVGGNITLQGDLDSDVNEAKTIFGTVTSNTITLGGGGLVATAGDLKVGGNDIQSSGGTVAITLDVANVQVAGDLVVLGNHISGSAGLNLTLGSAGDVDVAGDLLVGGNDIKASDGNVNITMTSNTLTEIKGDLQVSGDDIKMSGGQTALTFSGAGDVEVVGDLKVSGNDIKSSTGSTAITLDDTKVIVAGDLLVNGTTTTINTVNLEIKDAVVGLGFASGSIQESAGDRGWIGGISGGDNVAFFWDNSATEFVVATTTNSATGSLPIPISAYSNFRAAEISGSIVRASLGLSGSLTQLTDGRSYLVAGSGIAITSGSNGQVTISNNAAAQFAKGYLLGNSPYINTGTGVVTFDSAGANIGVLSSADDEKLDVYLNGIFMAYGYDISTITTGSFTFDSAIASSLMSDDIISIVLRSVV